MFTHQNKTERSWILYDCGNSAYSLIMDTAIFPLYFALAQGADALALGYYKSLAGLIVALLSPILGTIADYKGKKKKFFTVFNGLGILMTALLGVLPLGDWRFLAIIFVLSNIGYAGANIFYDAFLVDVTDKKNMDSISSKGYAYGYIASILPFMISLIVIQFITGMDNGNGYRFAFILSALWWGLLSIPLHKNVAQKYYVEPEPNPIRMSFVRLFKTFKEIKSYKVIVLFLLAYFFYIDGVNTMIKMVVPYAESVLGKEHFNAIILLAILLIINILAFPFSLLFGQLSKKFGCLNMVRLAIFVYTFTTIAAYFITNMYHVFFLGILISFAQGGIQALSRSYFAKIIPREKSNEFFGFYNIFGKFSAILGPFIMSFIAGFSTQAQTTILGIIPLFIIGFIISLLLPKEDNVKPYINQ